MSPITHLLASWLVAAKTTRNARDCRLATMAGLLPDADGVGLIVDIGNVLLGRRETHYYGLYHHYGLHGAFGAVVITLALTLFARDKGRVALTALLLFHLHLLGDFLGSRGPSVDDLWPIFYLGPFEKDPMWLWKGQWALDGWQNRIVFLAVFVPSIWLTLKLGRSPVGVFSERADKVFVEVLRGWEAKLRRRLAGYGNPEA